jgi:hypothetical protein
MANVQNVVGLVPALGVDGQQVVVGQAEYLAYNPLSDGTVKAGTFCFKKTNSGNGEKFALASLLGAEDAEPLGFVERVVDTRIDGANASTDVYPEGAALTVAIRGQYYITAPAAISADGLGVFINPTTGAISIASSADTGEVDTGWVCRIPNGGATAALGDLVIVERF